MRVRDLVIQGRAAGITAAAIAPENEDVEMLFTGANPGRIQAAYLSCDQEYALADQAVMRRLGARIAKYAPRRSWGESARLSLRQQVPPPP